jgi:hypothetical protein
MHTTKVFGTKVTPTITNEETLKNKTNKYTMSLVHQLPFEVEKTDITQ